MVTAFRALIEVDLREKQSVSGSDLFIPYREGSLYEQAPEVGTLVKSPDISNIPEGRRVYFQYDAIGDDKQLKPNENVWGYKGKTYISCPPHYIKAYEDKGLLIANSCILLEHTASKQSLLDFELDKKNVTEATVISSDHPDFKKGDVIKYLTDNDFELHVDGKTFFYLDKYETIVEKNGECYGGWNQIETKPPYTEVGGILLPNPPTIPQYKYKREYNAELIRAEANKHNITDKEAIKHFGDRVTTKTKIAVNMEAVVARGDFKGKTVLISATPLDGWIHSKDLSLEL